MIRIAFWGASSNSGRIGSHRGLKLKEWIPGGTIWRYEEGDTTNVSDVSGPVLIVGCSAAA